MHKLLPLALTLPLVAAAQSPSAYSVVQINGMFGAGLTQKIYRDGSKAIVDNLMPPQNGQPQPHGRTLYDLDKKTSLSWDADNSAVQCSTGTWGGDWGDPFASSESLKAEIAKAGVKESGAETILGISAKVYEGAEKDTSFKAWIDPKSGLILRLDMAMPGQSKQTMIQVKEVSLAKPPASVFAVPASCSATPSAPALPDRTQRYAEETGGQASDYLDAIMAPATPSKTSCTLLFRAVAAGSMQTLTGYKVQIDNVDRTAQMRNGILRIDNAPDHFDVSFDFGNAGGGGAMIYRQCPKPQTVLLMVVKDPSNLGRGADYMFVQAGKFAQ